MVCLIRIQCTHLSVAVLAVQTCKRILGVRYLLDILSLLSVLRIV